tara:strand:- start:283 stop:570 length:288 start_codon:yes stop_codon:yes gene_type:complete
MNIGEKPKIADSFAHLKKAAITPVKMPKRVLNRVYWSTEELFKFANLKAIGLSLKECSIRLGKSENACNNVIFHYDLYAIIEDKRQELIQVILNE